MLQFADLVKEVLDKDQQNLLKRAEKYIGSLPSTAQILHRSLQTLPPTPFVKQKLIPNNQCTEHIVLNTPTSKSKLCSTIEP